MCIVVVLSFLGFPGSTGTVGSVCTDRHHTLPTVRAFGTVLYTTHCRVPCGPGAADATAHHIKHWLADAAASYSARPVTPLYRSQSTRAYVPRASCWQTTICFRLAGDRLTDDVL
ncbi:hypothetical protein BD311DRAFT_228657 [Dichomitus squalens]|uniref:Secreted protein n=1 Tax=Dichomitus squalens TaxID=114155 RepID=A0A4Q9M6Q4_9APHY|nr:hypothetical protein BD311DRAFT_228657 [Dichomitus squalens]